MKNVLIILAFLLSASSWGYETIKCQSDDAFVEIFWSSMFSYQDNELTVEWNSINTHYIFDNSRVESGIFSDGDITWFKKVMREDYDDFTFEYYGNVNEKSWVVLKHKNEILKLSCDK